MSEQPSEARLEEQRDNLRLLNQVMRHDIRNDLQLIGAYAELLEEHVDEEGREYLDVIKENTESATNLTATARDLSKVILGAGVESEAVSLANVLDQQIDGIRSGYPEAVVTVEGTVPESGVVANNMLSSVFRNLLQNAIQHNDQTPPEVTVSTAETDDRIEIRVVDNGPGIPEDQREDIFGRGEKGLESAGAGIGLYLVRSLVESYGGDVWIEDNDPRGSVFVVSLPIAE